MTPPEDITAKIKWTIRCAYPLCDALGFHITGMMQKPLSWYCPEHKGSEKRVLH